MTTTATDGLKTARVVRTILAQRAVEGDGFVVRRPFPTAELSHLDPFLLFDHMGPIEFSVGGGTGTPWHPHRGFETVTYLVEGDAVHRDSMGNHGRLGTGDTQWMTAGSGVLHKEGPSPTATRIHGLQLWVNLPADKKMMAPAYQDLRAADNAVSATHGVTVRVIAGELFGLVGPGSTQTPISYAHVSLAAESTVTTALPAGHVVLVYPLTGSISVAGTQVAEGTLAVVEGSAVTLAGRAEASEVIVLTGRPIGEPVARYGPFVMNTKAEIAQAFDDYNAGLLGTPQD